MTFDALARELARSCASPRPDLADEVTSFQVGRFELRVDGTRIELDVEMRVDTWRSFEG